MKYYIVLRTGTFKYDVFILWLQTVSEQPAELIPLKKNSSCVDNRSSLVTVGRTLLFLVDVTGDSAIF